VLQEETAAEMGMSKKQLKLVSELDRRLEMVREFMNDWLLFNQIMSAYPSPGVNKAQLENQFLKIKSKLAREHKVLKETLKTDYSIDGNAMNIVSGATSLESIYSQSEVAVKKLQTEWHRAFITINETLGALEDKKARAEGGEKVFLPMSMDAAPVKGGGGGKGAKTLLIIVVIAAALAAIFFLTDVGDIYRNAFNDLIGG
jgi:hypothetical protein